MFFTFGNRIGEGKSKVEPCVFLFFLNDSETNRAYERTAMKGSNCFGQTAESLVILTQASVATETYSPLWVMHSLFFK